MASLRPSQPALGTEQDAATAMAWLQLIMMMLAKLAKPRLVAMMEKNARKAGKGDGRRADGQEPNMAKLS